MLHIRICMLVCMQITVPFFCRYIPHCGRSISRIYRALLYGNGIRCHKFTTPTLPLQSLPQSSQMRSQFHISRPDPSSVLLRQKIRDHFYNRNYFFTKFCPKQKEGRGVLA
jgi:hypothetical protein